MANPMATDDLVDHSDEQLARRVQEGCADSFAELDCRFRPRLLHVLARRLPTREDAEDVLQQTLLRVYEKIQLYDPRQRLSPWIFTIALRLAAGHTRKKTLPMKPQAEDHWQLIDAAHSPYEQARRREERDQLWRIADRVLKAEQWTALWLFYGEEQSINEVAQSLGRTKTSVSVLLFRARKALLPHLRKLTVMEDDAENEEISNIELSPTLLLDSCSGDAHYQLSGRSQS